MKTNERLLIQTQLFSIIFQDFSSKTNAKHMLEKSSLPSLSLQLQSSSQGRDLFTLFVRVKMITITRFKYIVEGIVVPQISLLGVIANTLTILVLNHSDVKLKKSLVDILCGLATFDNLFLISIFPMFTLPVLSEWWVLMRFFLFQFLGENTSNQMQIIL